MVVITHYQRLLDHVVPDKVHVLAGGRIVRSGGSELALELESRGYAVLGARAERGGLSGSDRPCPRRGPIPFDYPASGAAPAALPGAGLPWLDALRGRGPPAQRRWLAGHAHGGLEVHQPRSAR